ncbi:hypothetical protein PoB_005684100 [Plakobranchus ocellatus]|uniref:Uncharacterized protein n=1 Tax=Plakobranchus ocellatus TaxID=259542 RepID=A0AAV4CC69_9GAST|nr:hypothetical protein PoB_005684100 [Plakobranchus ocellatus]
METEERRVDLRARAIRHMEERKKGGLESEGERAQGIKKREGELENKGDWARRREKRERVLESKEKAREKKERQGGLEIEGNRGGKGRLRVREKGH